MDKRTDLYAKTGRGRLERRLDRCRIEAFHRRECFAQRLQAWLVFGNKMLSDTIWLVADLVQKIETTVGGQFAENPELSLAGFERRLDVVWRELRRINPGLGECGPGEGLEADRRAAHAHIHHSTR